MRNERDGTLAADAAEWRRSTYSGGHNECVEVALAWRASSYSGGQDECVEVADGIPRSVPVRDSKRPDGPVIAFSRDTWRAFVASVR